MKLYVACASWDDSEEVIGVFSSHELAQAACDRHKYKDGGWRGLRRFVVAYELDQDTWNGVDFVKQKEAKQ